MERIKKKIKNLPISLEKGVDKWETIVYKKKEVYMQFVTVRDFRTSPASIWRKLPSERELIITNNGKPIALLTPLSDETLEDTVSAVRRAKAINAMRKMQELSVSSGNDKMTLEEINTIIKDARGKEQE